MVEIEKLATMTTDSLEDPFVNAAESHESETIELPRVGGIYSGTAWTGGSAIAEKRLKRPKTIFARRPSDFRGASKIEEVATKGLREEKRLGLEKSQVSLTTWIGLVRTLLEESGQDSVFRVDDGESTIVKSEIYLLEDWGRANLTLVLPWVEKLRRGGGK